jgi:hypothetical protein
MDSNDPANPNSTPLGGVTPASDPNSVPQPQPPLPSPSDQIISDVSQTPPSMTAPPQGSTGSPWGPPETPQAPAPASPWETPASSSGLGSPAAAPGFTPLSDPAAPAPPAPPSEFPATTPADVPTAPAAPEAANPFLQPQNTGFSVPQTSFDQMPAAPNPLPPAGQPAAIPNPMANPSPDPLNTAFNPTGTPPANPFAQPQMPAGPDISGAVPASPTAAAPLSPWETPPPAPPGDPAASAAVNASTPPVTGFVSTPPENPLNAGQPGTAEAADTTIVDQPIPATTQSGTLDLSSLQNAPASDGSQQPLQPQPPTQPPGAESNNSQGNSPVENAPTDLSHLIAGDENGAQPPMGDIYTPPVAQDRTPGAAVPQTPSTEGGSTAPPEKHLNLTKVLLVAGIPIILVVAALSAYLILGVGKSAPEDTSLPVEQTQQDQAPLTNPPQQIVAPSPAVIPEPGTSQTQPGSQSLIAPSPVPSPSPEASLSPAMRAAQQKASASPIASPSPAASASTSLPQ